MSQAKRWQSNGATNLSQLLASEARLNRLHSLFQTHFNVTEPSVILEPYLFLGNCISAHDTNSLATLGIRYILNVAIRDVEVCPYYPTDMRILTIDLRDDDRENILRTFDQVFSFIDEAKRTKSRILVHCSHGQSRSPAIVIAYLMRTYNVSLEKSLLHVVKARPCVLPNDGFLKQLILFDRFLVERRRQRQEASLTKPADGKATTEISISTVAPSTTTPPILAAPPYLATEVNMPSVDSSSKTQPLISADSIHVIPIQVPPTAMCIEKIETIPIKKLSMAELKIRKKRSKENVSVTPSSKSNHSESSKRRQTTVVTTIVKPPPSQPPRSHSAHTARTRVRHISPPPFTEKRHVTTYYPQDYYLPQEKKPTKYIVEIYDKATNRFIPTNKYFL